MNLDSGVVENRELGVSYRENYEPLSKDKQVEMGINGIRRKEVIVSPEKMWESMMPEQLYYLTEGSFPSFSTWNHAMWGDGGIDRTHYNGRIAWREWLEDGGYFQSIGGNKRGKSMVRKYHDNGGVFNLAMLVSGDSCWRDSEDCPVFVFGNKNKAFQEYLKQIEDSEEAQTMLRHAGWSFAPELILGEAAKPTLPKYSASLIDDPEGAPRRFAERFVVRNTPEVYSFKFARKPELTEEDIAIVHDKLDPEKKFFFDRPDVYWALLGQKDKAIELLREPVKMHPGLMDGEIWNVGHLLPMYLELGKKDDATRALSKALSSGGSGLNTYDEAILGRITKVLETEGIERAIETYHDEMREHGGSDYIRRANQTFEGAYSAIWPHHFDKVKFLTQGVPSTHDLGEVTIPAVDHPKIKPLKWCHSDVGMIKNDRGNLEVLFFE
jgi:hypothetical protein